MLLLLLLTNTCLHAISICPKMLFYFFCKIIWSTICSFTVASIRLIFLSYGSTICDYFHILWTKILVTAPEILVCGPDSFTLSLLHQLRTPETALGSKINKLQQFFYTLSVSQDFSLFLDLTCSLNVLSITCILCKTVTSASRRLVIT